MPPAGREPKTKSKKPKRWQQVATDDADGAPSRSKWTKKGGRHNKHSDDSDGAAPEDRAHRRGTNGGVNAQSISNQLFVTWDQFLNSHQGLKMKLDSVVAVHGWEHRGCRRNLMGGFELATLLQSIRAEILAIDPAAEALEKADLLLELQKKRAEIEALGEERDRLTDNVFQLREDCFEAQEQMEVQSAELDSLRQQVTEHEIAQNTALKRAQGSSGSTEAMTGTSCSNQSSSSGPAIFQGALLCNQLAEGKAVVQALERLKLPDESSMSLQDLACWHENKKTIKNSLRTLSGQIYSARTRIIYEIIQNADDCSFNAGVRPELVFETNDAALIAWHNESGFQPKDLYALCQVGESSKAAGSGKIGRKGIGEPVCIDVAQRVAFVGLLCSSLIYWLFLAGFKSVFQICNCPVIISPPFQFCFDTDTHGAFGFIVPSWVEHPSEHVPQQYLPMLDRLLPTAKGAAAESPGTMLVCPMTRRGHGRELLRELSFDGLSLAFLKNLQKIRFAASPDDNQVYNDSVASSHEYLIERTDVFEHGGADQEHVKQAAVLNGITIVNHRLSQCAIIEIVVLGSGIRTEIRRRYRLHTYTIEKYKGNTSAASAAQLSTASATTTISLAFPVDDELKPLRTAEGEHVFAYLPVTVAGLGFAINADFELVASRQDVNDSHSGNHMLLGRIPALFVHAILTDPVLGEDAFPTYLPDVDAVCRDRTGSGRKWYMLASALHRETEVWMIIPTEDEPERVRRRNIVLRPRHLSRQLVSNSLLKAVTEGELHFAHPDAVASMCLESCIDVCPVSVVLDCLRAVLDQSSGSTSDDTVCEAEFAQDKIEITKKSRSKKASRAKKNYKPMPSHCTLSDEKLQDIWEYLSTEVTPLRSKRNVDGLDPTLKLIVSACIGDASGSSTQQPMRIFPVRGSRALRLHCEHGVPLCLRISASLTEQPHGAQALRLAERCVPLLDVDRLEAVEGIEDTMQFLQVGEATEVELELQLRNCFRFGFATAADPQLWWDSFQYAVSRGCLHGLVDFMDGAAVALPLDNGKIVSSHDANRLSVTMPCILGLQRKATSKGDYIMAIPPSATSWGARVCWELAMVQAFGITYPKADIERLPILPILSEVLCTIAEARETRDIETLHAFSSLLNVYEQVMSTLIATLRVAADTSARLEECLLDPRPSLCAFASCCSPKYIDELMQFAGVTRSDPPLFHNTKHLLEDGLGMLQLQQAGIGQREMPASIHGVEQAEEGAAAEETLAGSTDTDTDEDTEEDIEAPSVGTAEACDVTTWEILSHLLGFKHSFDPSQCAWVLYSALHPLLWDENQMSSDGCHVKPFVQTMSKFALTEGGSELWPEVCQASGVWLQDGFFCLERCVWETGDSSSPIWQALLGTGCRTGFVVPLKPVLHEMLKDSSSSLCTSSLLALENCCISGASPLPHPTVLQMMLDSVLPWLLELEDVVVLNESLVEAPELPWQEHSWSQEISMCYSSVATTVITGGFLRGKRWQVPVPSATLSLCRVVIDAGFNRLIKRNAEALIIMPDAVNWPASTDLVLNHFGHECLHPGLAGIFSPIVERQSIGLESPVARIQRKLSSCLRLIQTDESSNDMHIWGVISEVCTGLNKCSDNDLWDLLLWAAIKCATHWHRMQTTGAPDDAASYQEILLKTRRLVPLVTESSYADGETERWSFMSSSQRPDAVLLLQTLFGFNLWGNLSALEIRGHPPNLTADIPTGIIFNCASGNCNRVGQSLFPEQFDRATLILIWEWFLLEVAGAAPPAVLWASFQEPIAAWARPRIRAAEASLRQGISDGQDAVSNGRSLEIVLLESILEHTQIDVLFDEMDAADETRRAAAAHEAEIRRQERQEAAQRRREENEICLQERERDQQASRTAQARQQEQRQRDVISEVCRQMEDQEAMQEAEGRINRSTARHQPPPAQHPTTQVDISNHLRRMLDHGGSGNHSAPVQRHRDAPMMRQSEIRGKLVRFLAGMRAYERQHASEGEGISNGGGKSSRQRQHNNEVNIQAAAQYYLVEGAQAEAYEDSCAICLEELGDASVYDILGEPVVTACGHCFHAVCFARHMESSMQDPWCPVCRATDMTVRFRHNSSAKR